MVRSRRLNVGLWTGWVQAMHPQGVHEGVQKWRFVRGSRGACNPLVAPCQFRPATKGRNPGFIPWVVSFGFECASGFGRKVTGGDLTVPGPATNVGHADELRVPLVGALSSFFFLDDQRYDVALYLAFTPLARTCPGLRHPAGGDYPYPGRRSCSPQRPAVACPHPCAGPGDDFGTARGTEPSAAQCTELSARRSLIHRRVVC